VLCGASMGARNMRNMYATLAIATIVAATSSRCGTSWAVANSDANGLRCTTDNNCPRGMHCFGGVTNTAAPLGADLPLTSSSRCGSTWTETNTQFQATPCQFPSDCQAGQHCFGGLNTLRRPRRAPRIATPSATAVGCQAPAVPGCPQSVFAGACSTPHGHVPLICGRCDLGGFAACFRAACSNGWQSTSAAMLHRPAWIDACPATFADVQAITFSTFTCGDYFLKCASHLFSPNLDTLGSNIHHEDSKKLEETSGVIASELDGNNTCVLCSICPDQCASQVEPHNDEVKAVKAFVQWLKDQKAAELPANCTDDDAALSVLSFGEITSCEGAAKDDGTGNSGCVNPTLGDQIRKVCCKQCFFVENCKDITDAQVVDFSNGRLDNCTQIVKGDGCIDPTRGHIARHFCCKSCRAKCGDCGAAQVEQHNDEVKTPVELTSDGSLAPTPKAAIERTRAGASLTVAAVGIGGMLLPVAVLVILRRRLTAKLSTAHADTPAIAAAATQVL